MKLLLVNDEILTANRIKEDVDWKQFGIDEVLVAYDADSAKKILGSVPVDILLCDIEMPEEDGISVIRWVRNESLDVECIFLTCHANFDYAKAAIELDCQDYIVMPIDYEALKESVIRAQARISTRRENNRLQKIGKELIQGKTESRPQDETRNITEAIPEICDYIMSHVGDPDLSVNALAERFYSHPVYLNRIFRKEKGVSLSQYITNIRMDMAQSMLRDSSMKVADVAEAVGYRNYTNFHSIFKKTTEISPTQFREQYGIGEDQ